jgi:drug/metabolite transporter (DMT)-like permease
LVPASSDHNLNRLGFLPIFGLLLGATAWGILWYPFRVMQTGGLAAPVATFLCYAVTVMVGAVVLRHVWREFLPNFKWLIAIGLAAGVTNVSYLVAVMEADVIRIVLLFYLAPLWTVPLAHWVLKEKLTAAGYATVAVAMTGAFVMLWRPELGVPAPRNAHEWLGLVAGVAFALSNVLVKRCVTASPQAKSLAGAIGVAIVALPVAIWQVPKMTEWATLAAPHAPLILLIGVVLLGTSIALQYGLSKVSANRAAVILLFELIIAAIAAHYLANEVTRIQDWIGGAMIVGAGLIATMGGGRRH